MNFLETSNELTKEDLAFIEQQLNIKFPQPFKEHYLVFNGGYPEFDEYTSPTNEKYIVNTFGAFKYDGFFNIEQTYIRLGIESQYLPVRLLPFAVDDIGNFFVISCREYDYENIFYLNNEQYSLENRQSSLTFLEYTFDKFLASLDH